MLRLALVVLTVAACSASDTTFGTGVPHGGAGGTADAVGVGVGGGSTVAATTAVVGVVASSSASSGQGGAGTGGAPAPGCAGVEDCPGADTECAKRTCVDGVCGVDHFPDSKPLAAQVKGDCYTATCGGPVYAAADVATDGNDCTDDVCTQGGTTHPLSAKGKYCTSNCSCEPCGMQPASVECQYGLCDAGKCVEFIPVQCKIGNSVFYGCNLATHSYIISWGATPAEKCGTSSYEIGYCASGKACTVFQNGNLLGPGVCL